MINKNDIIMDIEVWSVCFPFKPLKLTIKGFMHSKGFYDEVVVVYKDDCGREFDWFISPKELYLTEKEAFKVYVDFLQIEFENAKNHLKDIKNTYNIP